MAKGEFLERLRRSLGKVNQKEFAEKISMTESTYGRTIRGERSMELVEMNSVAQLFNLPVSEVLRQYELDDTVSRTEDPAQKPYGNSQVLPIQLLVTLDGNPA